ncbi:alpha/beta hydrolase [Acinetobacter indicus]|uniref:alpha/beta fold hydrolase n=1 Tax=Acinetobacter indicus TaxID=756892 RepID=UPI0012666F60|nr:alpha/beta hydrolase [Acinetobacter indicus]QFS17926.1 alpha/beta hydrolase [Acinetobacter indicus]QIC72970.1 alpha/beta hydrolase [Acinetobacter indicus]UNW03549.1 alpha/beta fold hydrolase [Acinetobacter indicus]
MNSLRLNVSPYSSFMHETKVDLGNGIELHVEMGGEIGNPTILLVMGLGAQLLYWPDFFCKSLIDQGFRVIRFDNRDIGLSSKVRHQGERLNTLKLMGRFALGLENQGAPYNLYDMADDVALLIDKLELEQVDVIGASMGGMIAQILAARYPDKVRKLALLFTSNNQPFLPPPFPKQLFSLVSKPASNDEEGIINHSLKLFKVIGSPGYLNEMEAVQTARKLYQRSYHPAGVLQQFLAILCTGSLRSLDKQIQQPTLVVHGSRDRLLPPAHGKAVAKAIPDAKFELIEGMGHDIPPHFIPYLSELFAHHFKL